MKLYFKLLFGALILVSLNIYADDIEVDDLQPLKNYNFLVRSKNISEVKKQISAKKEPAYVESFLMGILTQNDKNKKAAVLWYARAAFQYKPFPANATPQVIRTYMESGTRRSGLYSECIYEISRIFLQSQGAEAASQMLIYLPDNLDEFLKKKVLELRVEIIGSLNKTMAIEIYRGILKDYQSPNLYLKMGGLNYLTGNAEEALKAYFKTMEFPENDWAYQKASQQIELTLTKFPALREKLAEIDKVRFAEGLRLDKRYPQSLALWKSIDTRKLDDNGRFLYVQNYCRLNINLRQFSQCVSLVQSNLENLHEDQKEKILADAGERLFNYNQFFQVVRLIPENKYRSASLLRIRSLDKLRDARRREEAKKYILTFDKESYYAEGVSFGVCFEFFENENLDKAKECFGELREITNDVSTGGRARYFLARIYEKLGDKITANEVYKEVYINSPEHFYAFGALARASAKASNTESFNLIPDMPGGILNPEMNDEYLKKIRLWIADNYNNRNALNYYFQEKKKRPGFGVDKFWIDFEEKLKKTSTSMTISEMKASLFSAMGYDTIADQYLQNSTSPERKYMVLLNAGLVTDDAYAKFTYLQALLNLFHKQADIMTLSPLAAQCLFPMPFRDKVASASEKYKVEEAQVYALMKQESSFHPGATSRSGARGLMQIMPATATWINKKLKIRHLNLYDPGQSIEMGAVFYSWLNTVSEGHFEKMAIAYNAGPGRLQQWINRYYNNDMEIFLEKIPADETYYYVQKTRKYYDRYKILIENFYPAPQLRGQPAG